MMLQAAVLIQSIALLSMVLVLRKVRSDLQRAISLSRITFEALDEVLRRTQKSSVAMTEAEVRGIVRKEIFAADRRTGERVTAILRGTLARAPLPEGRPGSDLHKDQPDRPDGPAQPQKDTGGHLRSTAEAPQGQPDA